MLARRPMHSMLFGVLLLACSKSADDTAGCEYAVFHVDGDLDGFGGPATTQACAAGPGLATSPDDCDDDDAEIHPGAEERCANGLDDDCDGEDAASSIWFTDADGDGFGDLATKSETCAPGEDAVANGDDCDDGDAAVNPSATELCGNTIDDDCDGKIAGAGDADADTYLSAACGGDDCDDANAAIHPGATDECNDGVDDDCSGTDAYCGFEGEYFLADVGLHYPSSEPNFSAGRSVETGDLDGDGDDDLLVSTVMADSYNGGAFLLRGPLSADGPLQDHALRIESSLESKGAGRSLGIADVNADGIDDMGLGAPYGTEGEYVVYGPVTADVDLSDADAVLVVSEHGLTCGHGSDLADIDGDAIGDAMIGAYSSSAGGHLSGVVFVEFGPLSGEHELLGEADATLIGDAGQLIGQTLRAAGDVDGDGIGDFVVNGVYDDTAGTDAGAVFVVTGPPPDGDSVIGDIAAAMLLGPAPYATAGFAMAAGDIDGDGLTDVVSSADKPNPGGAYVVFSPPVSKGLADADAIIMGTTVGVGGGLGAGDLDGNDVDELLVGAPIDGTSAPYAGAAYLVVAPPAGTSSIDDVAQASFYGAATYDQAGVGLTVADLDVDGNRDIVIGAPSDGGGVFVVMP
jgi:hypothetical protein